MFSSRIIEDISAWAKFFALVIGVPAAIIGLFKAVFEIRENREQRATELRWKQANTAKELLNDIHEHGLEKHAIHMLDWCEGKAEYEIAPGTSETISYDDVKGALSMNANYVDASPKQRFVRDCFDWFFFRIDRIEHYIHRDLIDFADVKAVFKVYAREIAKDKQIYIEFLEFHGYDLAKAFLERYWQPA